MKYILTLLCLYIFNLIQAQTQAEPSNINDLKTAIKTETNNTKKLILLDSLTQLTYNQKELGFDSISRATIDFAIQLDSFNLASRNTQDLINFHNNVLGQPKEGIAIFNTYFNQVKDHITDRNLAGIYIDAGDSYYFVKEVDTAMAFYDKAKFHADKAGNDHVKAFAILYQGYYYSDEGNFVKASQYLQEASEIFIKVKDTFNIISSKNALSILYSSNGFAKEGQQERKEAIALAKLSGNNGSLVTLYVNSAEDYKKQGRQDLRISYLKKAMEAAKSSRNLEFAKPILLHLFVVAYAQTDSIAQAKHYLKALTQDKRNTQGIYESNYYRASAQLAYAENDYKAAQKWGTQFLDAVKTANQWEHLKEAEAFLAKTYEKLNQYNQAYSHLNASKKIEDSLQSVQKNNALSYYQTLYETNKRDQKIAAQNTEIKLLDEQNKHRLQLLWISIFLLLGIFSIIYLWRSRQYSRKKVQLQKVFAQDLIRSVETERKRISSELHDSVGQSLLLIKNKIFLDHKDASETTLVDNAIDEVRSISQQLHPFQFEKLGLIKSIKNTIEAFQKNSTIFYSEDIEDTDLDIPKEKEIFIFRMIQECLNNVEKHSQAKACVVSIENINDAVLFEIKDNGRGFDVTEDSELLNSLGMKTMKERAQITNTQLSINSVKGKGTSIQIKVPKQ
ncbi:tetratricopeptide repeat-containing sensor histidine kinase [Formosa sp. A9]|uniref:tetratricopeptide repeat-containing sensor histidine kinase n=1 Tax=Formosa sp. A9 TaxID=3442641 RepID=UPI003EBEA240